MDPVTILSLVSGAGATARVLFQVGESLYKFIERTRDVDQSIRGLHRETSGLGQTINAIHDALEHPTIKNHQTICQDYTLVWATLDKSLRDCDDTAKMMKGKFHSAQSARTSFVSKAWKQFKLGLKEDEIKDLRSQIHTHGSRLQLSLQMISVIASITSPERVIESISPRLDHLIAMVQNQPLPILHNVDPIQSQLSEQRNQEFHSAAQAVVSSASMIIGDSRSTVSGRSSFAGMAGSEMGTPLDVGQRDRIQRWIPPPKFARENVRSISSSSTITSAVFSPTAGSVNSSATGPETTITLNPKSSSTIGEFELETIKGIFTIALKALQDGSYEQATTLFEQIINKIKTVKQPFKGINIALKGCEMFLAHAHLQMQPMQCPYNFDVLDKKLNSTRATSVLDLSQDYLLGLLACQGVKDDIRHFASFALSVTYCYQDRLNEAYELCQNSVSILRKHGFKSFFQYKEDRRTMEPFLGLLCKICQLRGDTGEAAVYRGMEAELGRANNKTLAERKTRVKDIALTFMNRR